MGFDDGPTRLTGYKMEKDYLVEDPDTRDRNWMLNGSKRPHLPIPAVTRRTTSQLRFHLELIDRSNRFPSPNLRPVTLLPG